jgi:hypothetical protein
MAKKPAKKVAKKPEPKYQAGGFDQSGIMAIINQAERKRRSRLGYPWADAVKVKMVKACQGRHTRKGLAGIIKAMAPNG